MNVRNIFPEKKTKFDVTWPFFNFLFKKAVSGLTFLK
jgi:hypothetical protein